MITRGNFLGLNSTKLNKKFKYNYYEYLSLVKWEDGFTLKKCKYDESPTVITMLEKLKFPILIAFHIALK